MTKLSVLVMFAVLLALTVLGFYFDNFLKERFLDDTQQRMQRGFQRLAINLGDIEQELRDGISFIKTDEKFIASIDLINNYQDKNNYNTFLIDEEKKAIAAELLSRVKLSFNSDIALYDHNGELIAFAAKEDGLYQLSFISFAGGERKIYRRLEQNEVYSQAPLPGLEGNISILHKDYYTSNQMLQGSVITYHQLGDDLVIKSHQSIFHGGSGKIIAHIEMSNILDRSYFQQLSKNIDLDIRPTFDRKLERQANVLPGNLRVPQLDIKQSEEEYFGILKKEITAGQTYFIARLNKQTLNTVLNESREKFLLLLILVAASTLVLMRFVIKHNIQRPLTALMAQIRKIENRDYSISDMVNTGDELQKISQNVNQLASAVQERENLLQQSKNEQEYLSKHDALTDLPNRRYFAQRLGQALEAARRNRSQLAILFLDLDQFKVINDTLGHDVGDELLIQVAQRLLPHNSTTHALARIGGDEFNILIEGVRDITVLRNEVEQYLALFQSPFICSGLELSISASIGVALYPKDGEDSVTLIKHADLAMYKSKDKGRNNYSFYSDDLAEYIQKRARMTQALKQAIDVGNQFQLYYQPKISLATGYIHSVEALIRWHAPELGNIPPAQFIPLAEETGLIVPIGQWVLQQGCRDFVQLQTEGYLLNHVSINLSNVQLRNDDMMSVLNHAIALSGISPDQLELEITESYIANDVNHAIQVLQTFRDMGIGLAIDDFGTGYSSMSYLNKLPVTRIKIDKSFVDGLPHDKDSVALTRAVIALAKNFKLAITAEGVEKEDQLQFLTQEKCDEIQGYYFSKPLPLEELKAFYLASTGKKQNSNVYTLPLAQQNI
ncbi:MAG: EAL domain-containing protein [Gallionellaceae bacterium]|jgi:diguanylate cyclase (GGDEF)-like protein